MNKTLKPLFQLTMIAGLWLSACGPRPAQETVPPAGLEQATSTAAVPQPGDVTTQPAPAEVVTAGPSDQQAPTAEIMQAALPTSEPVAGIHLHRLNSSDELSLFEEAGAYWVRFDNFHWNAVEPTKVDPPAYLWEEVNEEGLLNAAQAGMKVIGMVLFAPNWAQKYPGVNCGPVLDTELERFGQFVEAAVSRYSQPPYNVHFWEIGNEPDVGRQSVDPTSGYGCWGEFSEAGFGGSYYADMLKVVYPRIKAADPQAHVLVGGLLLDCDPVNPPEESAGSGNFKDCSASNFLTGIMENGGGDYFDGVSFHAYDYYYKALGQYGNTNWNSSWRNSGPVLVAKSAFIRQVLADHGYTDKSLINTEVALLCTPEGDPACASEEFENTKAFYAAQANAAAMAEGLTGNVWYLLTGWRGSHLVSSGYQPNNAFQALRVNNTALLGTVYSRELTEFPGVKGYEFNREGKQLWMLWSNDGEDHVVQLPSPPSAVYDVFGSPLSPAAEMTVSLAPIYLEWEPNP